MQKRKYTGEKKVKYGLKRTPMGLASVAIATLLMVGQVQDVQAQESVATAEETVETSTEQETTTSADTVELSVSESKETTGEAETENVETETEETKKGETKKEVGNDPHLQIKDITEDETFGEESYAQVDYLTEKIGNRTVGTEGEKEAHQYITGYLKGLGYEVQKQSFKFTAGRKDNKKEYQSSNIITLKKGQSPKELIIGAHYDSVPVKGNTGADDNASGVALALETAKRIVNQTVPYTVRFIFFGAEEMGLQGSKAYTEKMTKEEIANTIGMVNIDSIIAGDMNYMYSGQGGEGWLRDQAFDIASALGIKDMQTNTGEYSEIPYGETGDWSDHAPFNQLGIPVVYLESSNWSLTADEKGNPIQVKPGTVSAEGYIQTAKHGRVYHTENDNLPWMQAEFPGRAQKSLKNFASILYNLVMNITPPGEKVAKTPQVNPSTEQTVAKVDTQHVAASKENELPATGMAASGLLFSGAALSVLTGLGLVTKKEEE